MSRKTMKLSKEQIKKIEIWSEVRLPMRIMAIKLGISKATLERMAQRDQRVKEALEKGRADSTEKVHAHLYSRVFKSDTMCIFFAKTQLGFRESMALTDPDGTPLGSAVNLTSEERDLEIKRIEKALDDIGDK